MRFIIGCINIMQEPIGLFCLIGAGLIFKIIFVSKMSGPYFWEDFFFFWGEGRRLFDVYDIYVLIYLLNFTLPKQICRENAMRKELTQNYESTMSEISRLRPELTKTLSNIMKSRFTLDLFLQVCLNCAR